jgi:hypothetical protein
MITAESFKKAQVAIEEAKSITKGIMPTAQCVFIGADNKYVYFNVVAKMSGINTNQMADITQKTRFQVIMEDCSDYSDLLYHVSFKMTL